VSTRPAPAVNDGLRLAVSLLTVVPVRAGRVDRETARWAMTLAPVAGLLVGAVAAAVLVVSGRLGFGSLLAAALAVGAMAALTRGLHLDGLADLADGLGSGKPADDALAIMKKSDIGPFGVVAIVLVLAAQLAAVAGVAHRPALALVATLAAALGAGRLAVTWACRHGVPAARPDGLGALVAGTVAWPVAVVATAALAVIAVPAVPHRPWLGPLAVLLPLGASVLLVRHAVRRLGGITGDVLGACVELTTTLSLVVLAF
jgi:adenosylcobinamide-GDP ribazoletransferase